MITSKNAIPNKFIFMLIISSIFNISGSIIWGTLDDPKEDNNNLDNNLNNNLNNKDKKKNKNPSNIFSLGEPTMFGSGCPADSVDIISSTDGQTVTVLFSEYSAMTDGDDKSARVACNLAIPVSVIQGFAVGVFTVDYRGYTIIPVDEGSYAEFNAEYFFAGNAGPITRKRYDSGYVGEVNLTDEVKNGAIVYSECGSNTIFRINTSIRAMKSYADNDDVFIEVDSTDTTVQQAFRYHMASRPCT